MTTPLIKEIKTVAFFDKDRYKISFVGGAVRYIVRVTKKLEEYRDKGIEHYRESVGTEEADMALEEGGTWGTKVHHACFLLATRGAVLFEPPAYETVGIENEEVAALVKQNKLVRQQLDLQHRPHLTIHDQYRFLQCRKFKGWLEIVKPEVLYAETIVYSLTHDIAGRMDFLFRVKGGEYPIAGAKSVTLPDGIILLDVKTGAWSDKYWLQMGAYRMAVKESLGIDVVATVGIHLKAATNSGLNTLIHTAEEADKDLQDFQHVAAIYDRKHKNDTPTEFEFESVLLSDQAREGIFLGATLPNPAAETQVEKEASPASNERAAQFSEDLAGTTDIETEQPEAVGTVDKSFLRKSHRRQ